MVHSPDGALEVPRTERAAGAGRPRADDALDELHVKEAPERESLLVLQKALREEEERAVRRVRVHVLHARPVLREHVVEQLLERRSVERAPHDLGGLAMLGERLEKMRITKPGHRLDRAELRALRAAR